MNLRPDNSEPQYRAEHASPPPETEERRARLAHARVLLVFALLTIALSLFVFLYVRAHSGHGTGRGGMDGTGTAGTGSGQSVAGADGRSGGICGTGGGRDGAGTGAGRDAGDRQPGADGTVASVPAGVPVAAAESPPVQVSQAAPSVSSESPVAAERDTVEAPLAVPIFGTLDRDATAKLELPQAPDTGTAKVPVPGSPYGQRSVAGRAASARENGASRGSEDAVEKGLRWLASHQQADGSWSDSMWTVGPTGLAVLAFLGAGYTHKEGKYRDNVKRALDWLCKSQEEQERMEWDDDTHADRPANTAGRRKPTAAMKRQRVRQQNRWILQLPAKTRKGMFNLVTFYEQGLATMALCEAFGMTSDAKLARPAQKALDCIVANMAGNGGYGYQGPGSDTHVTSFQVMALKSGTLAKLVVPHGTFDRLLDYYRNALADNGCETTYCAGVKGGRGGAGNPTPARTALGLYCRLFLNCSRKDSAVVRIARHLKATGPSADDFFQCYYGAYGMFQMGGEYWKDWNSRFRDRLVDRQKADGSWPVTGHTPGSVVSTALCVMSLEVYYRFLPVNR